MPNFPELQLTGFQRKDGRWGFRNQILLLPLHSALCAVARAISDQINTQSLVSVSHDWSGEVDKDWVRISKAFSGFAANPNNYAVVFLGLGNEVEDGLIKGAEKIGLERFKVLNLKDVGSMTGLLDSGKVEAEKFLQS